MLLFFVGANCDFLEGELGHDLFSAWLLHFGPYSSHKLLKQQAVLTADFLQKQIREHKRAF